MEFPSGRQLYRYYVKPIGLVFCAISIFSSCINSGSNTKKKTTTSGILDVSSFALEDDQKTTFLGRWKTPVQTSLPEIRIAFEAGQFTSAEKASITNAADHWNSQFVSRSGSKIFNYGSKAVPFEVTFNRSNSDTLCNSTLLDTTGKMVSAVLLRKVKSGWAFGSQTIAITTTCPTKPDSAAVVAGSGLGLSYFFNADLQFNYVDYFNSSKKTDIESIALHELGHVLGLDHSCHSSQTEIPGSVACSSTTKAAYLEAVMHPVASGNGLTTGDLKRELKINDAGRGSSVLYGPDALL